MTPSLALPHSAEHRRADHVRAGPGLAPREAGDRALDGAPQQPVPRGVELDLVDPVAVPVVGAQDRHVALGAPAVLDRLDAARPPRRPRGARSTPQPPPSRSSASASARSALEQVDRLQRRGLVEDLAGGIGDVDRRSIDAGAGRDERALGHPVGGVVGAAQQPARELRPAEEQRGVVLPGGADPAVDVDHRARREVERLARARSAPRSPPAGTRRAWTRAPSRRSTAARGRSPAGAGPRSARA